MPAALEYVGPGNWEAVQLNFDTISANLRQPMPSARVFSSVNLPVLTGALTVLAFNQERSDAGDLHSTVTNNSRLTAPITGWYMIGGHVRFAAAAGGNRQALIRLNGTTFIAPYQAASLGAAANPDFSVVTAYQMTAGDYVEVVVFQDSGGAINVLSAANFSPEFWMIRLGGFTNEGIAV